MENLLIAVLCCVVLYQWLSLVAAAHDLKSLCDRCTYLKHLVGGLGQ